MKLVQLRQFVTLAETLNFHRAAEVLNIAQPPLSVSIRKLEEELGTPLFVREPRGVQLTKVGEEALSSARQTLFYAEQVKRTVDESLTGERGRIRIGFVGSATYEVLPRLLPAFRTECPNIEISLEESRTSELLAGIQTGTFDVGIVRTPVLNPVQTAIDVLQTDALFAAVARDSRFAGRKRIKLGELSEVPFVVYDQSSVPSMHAITMLACQEVGFVPRVAEEATQLQTILCLVESGLGVALVPGAAAGHFNAVKFLEIADMPKAGVIGLGIVSVDGTTNPAAERFRRFAVQHMKGPPGAR
ncbi:MAG: LysR family transcriptional regulator [Novosphingobium sp.]|nr:LysR family transcriptional regulator [Novosphingobium sp.]